MSVTVMLALTAAGTPPLLRDANAATVAAGADEGVPVTFKDVE